VKTSIHGVLGGKVLGDARQSTTLAAGTIKKTGDQESCGASSLSDSKGIGCKNCGAAQISPLSWAIKQLLPSEIDKICSRSAIFSRRFFKSDRLLVAEVVELQRHFVNLRFA
jgi:hypothetical protein